MTQKRRKEDNGKAIGESAALRWEPTHITKPSPRVVPLQSIVRVTRAEHSRRFLSLNYAIEYVTTHLQEIP